jgi:hypothetical protein
MFKSTFFFIILCSHVLAFLPTWKRMKSKKLLKVVDWSILSVILYYDTGIAIEALNLSGIDQYFTNFFSADENTLIQAFFILFFLPWFFRLPSLLNEIKTDKTIDLYLNQKDIQEIKKSRKMIFYGFAAIIILISSLFGFTLLMNGGEIWKTRMTVSEDFGAYAIFLYLPIYLLSFYITKRESQTLFGQFISLILCLSSIISTLAIGQRTTVIIPIIILFLFRKNINLTKLISLFLLGMVVASTLLPIFKGQYSNSNYSVRELTVQTIQFDISRSNALISALERTEPIGTSILPYPMSGYAYSLLFFIPRQIAPFKGESTARYFTSDIVGTSVENTNWGFGIGVVEEALLNIGLWLSLPLLMIYGFCFYLMDILSNKFNSLVVPTRLAALWICGYNLPAILLLFGAMAITCLLLHHLFV